MNYLLDALLSCYSKIEEEMNIVQDNNDFSTLTQSNGNSDVPVQRWYTCKESFSINLLEKILDYWDLDYMEIDRILDPYLCIGTTLLSNQKLCREYNHYVEGVGIEVNPFFHFVSSSKLDWMKYRSSIIKKIQEQVLSETNLPPVSLPELSILHNERFMEQDTLTKILGLIKLLSKYDEKESNALLLGIARILEKNSGVRKDGRALRFVEKKNQPSFEDSLRDSWLEISTDIENASKFFTNSDNLTLLGDGRTLSGDSFSQESLGKFKLVLCSPPYLNNIDYSEVYKIELWIMGFINSYHDFRNLRKRTFRSHPSIKFDQQSELHEEMRQTSFFSTLNVLINTIPLNSDYNWRSRLFFQYFEDVYRSLKSVYRVLKDDGHVFWVIGNSLHGSDITSDNNQEDTHGYVPIATDLLTAKMAAEIGFTVDELTITRKLRRRSYNDASNYYLRETIISLRK